MLLAAARAQRAAAAYGVERAAVFGPGGGVGIERAGRGLRPAERAAVLDHELQLVASLLAVRAVPLPVEPLVESW